MKNQAVKAGINEKIPQEYSLKPERQIYDRGIKAGDLVGIKNMWIWIVIILIAVAAFVYWFMTGKKEGADLSAGSEDASVSEEAPEEAPEASETPEASEGSETPESSESSEEAQTGSDEEKPI